MEAEQTDTKPEAKKENVPAKKPKATKRGKPRVLSSKVVLGEATIKHFRMSPRKARLVVDMIRGKQVEPALQILRFSPKKASQATLKALEAAIANAKEKGADVDSLWVVGCCVNMGRTLKRYIPAAHGRAVPNMKRSSHFSIQVGTRA